MCRVPTGTTPRSVGVLDDLRGAFRVSPGDVDVGKALIRDRQWSHVLRLTGPRESD